MQRSSREWNQWRVPRISCIRVVHDVISKRLEVPRCEEGLGWGMMNVASARSPQTFASFHHDAFAIEEAERKCVLSEWCSSFKHSIVHSNDEWTSWSLQSHTERPSKAYTNCKGSEFVQGSGIHHECNWSRSKTMLAGPHYLEDGLVSILHWFIVHLHKVDWGTPSTNTRPPWSMWFSWSNKW